MALKFSRAAVFSRIISFLPNFPLFRFLQRRTTGSAAQGKPVPVPQSTDSSPPPTKVFAIPSELNQDDPHFFYKLAQRLRQLLPSFLNWLGSGDVQILETSAFASGGFAEMWRGSFQGQLVAIKSLRRYSSPEFDSAEVGIRFLKEVWASSQLSHPNIITFLGVLSTPTHPLAILYEMMDNLDLGQYLVKYPNVSRLKLLTEISRALKYMHSLDIIHGGVKARNVLVDDNGIARLGGLGSAFALSLPASWSDVDSEKLFCGFAPELISPDAFGFVHARTTKATDMFAFGMLAWEVFAGKQPFAGKIEAAVVLSVLHDDRPPRPAHPEVSERVWNAIQLCWHRDPFKRMSAADVVAVLEAQL